MTQDHFSEKNSMCFQVEGLMDDIDFKAKVTRAEFEELCADLFERVPRPVQDALTAAEMKLVSVLIACSQSVTGRPTWQVKMKL